LRFVDGGIEMLSALPPNPSGLIKTALRPSGRRRASSITVRIPSEAINGPPYAVRTLQRVLYRILL
jgi:hypothetical protein